MLAFSIDVLPDIDRVLSARGLLRDPTRGDGTVLSWSSPLDDAEVDCVLPPHADALWLEARGAAAADLCDLLAREVPVLTHDAVRALLESHDALRACAGIELAMLLRDDALLAPLLALHAHPDARVRAALAAHAPRSLAHVLLPQGRRQVLRWLMHDAVPLREPVIAALREGLDDPDWEVRATAMIACARLHARELAAHVARVELPSVSRLGPERLDRDILRGVQRGVLALLTERPFPPNEAAQRLRAALVGEDIERPDRVTLLVRSLATPLELAASSPRRLPRGVVRTAEAHRLEGTDIELCYVDRVPHWLGDHDPDAPHVAAIRRVAPEQGFFVATVLLSGEGETPETITHERALVRCRELGERSGARVRLPSADEWEMAARGSDGRRFPWGNGREASWRASPSPWGCLELLGTAPQWTIDGRCAGGPEVRALAHVAGIAAPEQCAIRVCVSAE